MSWYDRKAVILSAERNGLLLNCKSKKIQDNKDFMLHAVQQSGLYLGYASKRLKDDKEVVIHALKQNKESYCFASERLRHDIDVYLMLQGIMNMNKPKLEKFNDIKFIFN